MAFSISDFITVQQLQPTHPDRFSPIKASSLRLLLRLMFIYSSVKPNNVSNLIETIKHTNTRFINHLKNVV